MITLLAKLFIKNQDSKSDADLRKEYGVLCGGLGIVLNILLSVAKIVAGIISGSVSIISDAVNNITDAGSSLVMLVGFKLAGKKPDSHHPYGHGRIEYVTGFIISVLTILMGVEMLRSSIEKIIHPTEVFYSTTAIVILILAFVTKIYMYFYNNRVSVKLKSSAMQAVAIDSFSDAVATSFVLLCMMISSYKGLHLDGYCGVVISFLIIYAGITSARDTIGQLLGSPPDPEFVEMISKYVSTYDEVIGMHDLVIHDYGPGRMMISFHAEVPASGNILVLHDVIDNIEHKLNEALGCSVVIHMDPVIMDDDSVTRMRNLTGLLVHGVDESLTIHDFRMVTGPSHTNLIFDVVVPYGLTRTDMEIKEEIEKRIRELPGNHFAVISIDKPYV